jgi:N,N-dimethylformamidase
VTLALTENGECELRIHDGASANRSLRPADGTRLRYGRWYRARITADLGPGLAELEVASTDRAPSGPQRLSARTALRPAETGWLGGQGRPVRLVLAAAAAQGSQAGLAHFTGKIEAPVLTAGGPAGSQEVTVSWRLGPARGAVIEDDSGQHAELRLLNTPMTGVTGHCWNGGVLDYRQDPAQYAALAFHADDLTDAGWQTTATIALPETLTSGVYAAKLATAGGDRYVPFFVAPAMGTKRNRIAVLLPTFTYLAYANEHDLAIPAGPGDLRAPGLRALALRQARRRHRGLLLLGAPSRAQPRPELPVLAVRRARALGRGPVPAGLA